MKSQQMNNTLELSRVIPVKKWSFLRNSPSRAFIFWNARKKVVVFFAVPEKSRIVCEKHATKKKTHFPPPLRHAKWQTEKKNKNKKKKNKKKKNELCMLNQVPLRLFMAYPNTRVYRQETLRPLSPRQAQSTHARSKRGSLARRLAAVQVEWTVPQVNSP